MPLGATGGSPPYHWAITSGALPAVLSFDGTTGIISGTLSPTATTATGIVFQVTDSASATASTAPLTLTVTPGPSITTGASLPQGEIGAAYSQNLAASGGSGGFTWSVTVGSLPTGLALSSGGVISGTPTAPGLGTTSFTVQVTDSAGGSATQAFSLTVIAGPTISTGPTLPSGTVNVPYSGVTLAASGGTSPYTWSITVGSLPAGMSLDGSSGAISGTPTASGTANFTVQVADAKSVTATKAFTLTIAGGLTITNAPTLPTGEVGVSYSQTFTAAGGTSPYTWLILSGSLPSGLNPVGNTIVGIPTASGTFNFTVKVTDSASVTATLAMTLTIAPALTITTSPTLPPGAAGSGYSQIIGVSGGVTPYHFSIISGALPGGLSLDPSSGTILGTPSGSGTFNFTVQVTDSTSVTATKAFTLTIASGLTIITAPTLPAGVEDASYSATLSASGGTSPYNWSITSGGLPAGLNFSGTSGVFSGTPTQGGTFSFTVQATDSTSLTATKSFTLTIAASLAITTAPALPSGGVGTAYNQPLSAVGGSTPYTWSVTAGALPGGLSVGPSSGAITGTPSSVGSFSFTVQVTDNNSVNTTKAFTLSIVSALTVTTAPTLPDGAIGTAYSKSLTAVGGNAPYTWSITSGSLPAGVSLTPTTGALSGTPTSAGIFSFTAQVTDSASVTATKAFTITVVASLTITTPPILLSDSVGVGYTTTLDAAGGNPPYIWSVTAGGLPAGTKLDAASGAIFGTPTASGSFTFTVQVTDSASLTASKAFTISVAAGLTITTAPLLPNGAIGASYLQPLAAAGGATPYHWSVTLGALPKGLTLDAAAGSISGVPTSSGAFTFTVQVTDSASATATKQFTLSTSASLAITTPPALPRGSAGVSYSVTLAAAGGTSPYLWLVTSGSLPSGLTLGSATGLISGTPTGAGTFTFGVSVTDSTSLRTTQEFNLTIGSGLVITTPPQLPAGATGSAYSQTLSAAGGTAPYSWVVTKGTLPNGLTLSTKGTINGKPTANGASSFTVQVTDKTGATASEQFSLTIGAGLTITSGSTLSPGSLGQLYPPLTLAASGGTQPYTWSITGGALAGGMSLSASGTIAGTPTATGTFNFTVQVADASGAKASQAFTLSITPQALPQVNVAGLPETAGATQQIPFTITLASGYPLDITGSITISFEPDAVAPADDPAIQFSTNGRTANFRIPANTTNALFAQNATQIAMQTGTVSGAIKLSFALQAGGADLDASGLDRTITIARSVPSITNVSIVKSANGFEIHVTGYSPPRELIEADLTFAAAAGANLQTTSVTEGLSAVGQQWYQSATSVQYGSQFILVLPFTASQGSISAVGSMTVKLKNSQGISPGASVISERRVDGDTHLDRSFTERPSGVRLLAGSQQRGIDACQVFDQLILSHGQRAAHNHDDFLPLAGEERHPGDQAQKHDRHQTAAHDPKQALAAYVRDKDAR